MREIEYRAQCLEDINSKDCSAEIRRYASEVNHFLYKVLGVEHNNDNAMIGLEFVNTENPHSIGFPVTYSVKKFRPKKKDTATIGDAVINASADWGYSVFCKTAFQYYTPGCMNNGEVHCLVFDVDNIPEINNESVEEEDVLKFAMSRVPFLKLFPPHAVIATGNKGMHVIYTFSNNIMLRKDDMKSLMTFFGNALEADKGHLNLGATLRVPGTVNNATGKLAKGCLNPDYVVTDSTTFIKNCKNTLNEQVIMQMYNGELRFLDRKYYEDTYCDWDDNDNVIYPDKQAQEMCGYDLIGEDILTLVNSRYRKPYYTGKKPVVAEDDNLFKKKDVISSIWDVKRTNPLGMMMGDLRRYFEEEDGNISGHRNNFLFIATSILVMAGADEDVIQSEIHGFNHKFAEPLRDSEVNCIIRCCLKHKYRISAEYMKNALDLSEEFMQRSNICYTERRKAQRIEKCNKKHNMKRSKDSKRKKRQQYNTVRKLYLNGASVKDMMSETGLSRNTVKKYIRIVKSDIKNALREEYLKRKKEERRQKVVKICKSSKNTIICSQNNDS